jgi:hypothetical protein
VPWLGDLLQEDHDPRWFEWPVYFVVVPLMGLAFNLALVIVVLAVIIAASMVYEIPPVRHLAMWAYHAREGWHVF